MPLHYPTSTGRRARADQQRRASSAQTQDRLARPHHAHRDVVDGVHAAPGCPGEQRAPFIRPVPRPRLHLTASLGAGAQRQAVGTYLVPAGQDQEAGASGAADPQAGCAHARPVRISWARLLKRVFEIDTAHCPNCCGQLKIIAAIMEASLMERILTQPGLQARAPPRAPAKGGFEQVA